VSLILIAALTWPGRVLGKDNAIPWKIGEDQKRFKALTTGHPVVMGRHTWESLPFKLPGRTNLVLSGQAHGLVNAKGSAPDGQCQTLDQALELAAKAHGGETVFIIGGAKVYAEALARADHLCLTLVHRDFERDAHFPALDFSQWTETFRERHSQEGSPAFDYEYLDLQRKRP
jgi:dihydrofolate reductase